MKGCIRYQRQRRENDVFKSARVMEKNTRDLGNVRCIKGDDGKDLVGEANIKEKWQSYFSKLFNGQMSEYSQGNEGGDQVAQQNFGFCNHISKEKVMTH